MHLRILLAGEPISISDILPMLRKLRAARAREHPYQLGQEAHGAWIQDFELEARDLKRPDLPSLEPLFRQGFLAAWHGDIENDGSTACCCASLSARRSWCLRGEEALPEQRLERRKVGALQIARFEFEILIHAPCASWPS